MIVTSVTPGEDSGRGKRVCRAAIGPLLYISILEAD